MSENAELKKDFIKEVHAAARSRYAVDVFADMVRTMAIALESPFTLGERKAAIEAEYEQIKGRYDEDEFAHFPRALSIVYLALEQKREDFLGHALEALGAANTRNGQFLTPVCVSRMMAQVGLRGLETRPGEIIRLSDPSCGSSVLLIEGAEKLLADGIPQRDILLIAGDIDGRACDISYVQLALLGYAAVVQHADALAMRRVSPDRFTPGWYLHGMPMRRPFRHPDGREEAPKAANVRELAQAEFDFAEAMA